MKQFIAAVFIALVALIPVPSHAGAHDGRAYVPTAAIDACSGKNSGESCTLTAPQGETITSTCETLNAQLVCAPPGGRHPHEKLLVGANGTAYVMKQDARQNSLITAISLSGSVVTYTSSTKLFPLMLSNDESALITGSYAQAADTATVSIIPLPLTENPSLVNVSLKGRIGAPPVVKNNRVYVTTLSGTTSSATKNLTVLDLSGTVLLTTTY